jgi:hypothetical protein
MLRRWATAGVLSCAVWGAVWPHALADVGAPFKADPTPAAVVANTLLVEAEQDVEPAAERRDNGGDDRSAEFDSPVLAAKFRPKTCAAAAVRIPRRGVRVITASHCAGDGLALFDGDRWLSPRATKRSTDGSDLAVLEFAATAWSGLPLRLSSSLAIGERLCAWHMSRGATGVRRESICGRLIERRDRPSGYAWLVIGHPYPSGTSGSPLVDADGRVVGVVVASDGMAGFAEPIEAVFAIANGEAANVAPTTSAHAAFVRP